MVDLVEEEDEILTFILVFQKTLIFIFVRAFIVTSYHDLEMSREDSNSSQVSLASYPNKALDFRQDANIWSLVA